MAGMTLGGRQIFLGWDMEKEHALSSFNDWRGSTSRQSVL